MTTDNAGWRCALEVSPRMADRGVIVLGYHDVNVVVNGYRVAETNARVLVERGWRRRGWWCGPIARAHAVFQRIDPFAIRAVSLVSTGQFARVWPPS